eukprot:CAMPEP_0170610976 /NCGR_PEP_ID=MMETSP0224-20130122/22945_1 /TAXON_ID=285029 /ORGANISM="Togula jolla, Strain CCCM 725" /LENGTH=206 /DNA_ID=CAMNT_0010936385 /DNA_START=176 /DNA_END=796 /DNA_ORIENTATION=-
MASIQKHFNSFPVALLTHFAVVSGGANWWDLWYMLQKIDAPYGFVFAIYILIMVLIILNVITGIFVNDAVEMSQAKKEHAIQASKERRDALFVNLREIFHKCDSDGSGSISKGELRTFMKEKPDLVNCFTDLDLDGFGAAALFDILDINESGTLEIEEFVMGCMRLTGPVKMMELAQAVNNNKKILHVSLRRIKDIHSQMATAPDV